MRQDGSRESRRAGPRASMQNVSRSEEPPRSAARRMGNFCAIAVTAGQPLGSSSASRMEVSMTMHEVPNIVSQETANER